MEYQFQVRRITRACELPLILGLKQEWREETKMPPMSIGLMLQGLISDWRTGSRFFVAETDSNIAGFGIGKIANKDYYSNGIFISRDFRRRGIGIGIKRAQIQDAINNGCRELITSVSEYNLPSIELQRKIGAMSECDGAGYRFVLSLG